MELKWLNRDEVYNLFQDEKHREDYQNKKFKYLELSYISSDKLCFAFENDQPVGCLQLGQSPQDKNLYWMKFVTVHPDFRQKGIARILITEMCRYISQIPNARIELSSYEKEGEVMIPMVQEIAHEFSNLCIKHRYWGTPYQNAKQDLVKMGDVVEVDDSENNIQAIGEIMYFIEYEEPLKAMIKIKNKDEVVKVQLKYLKKK
jgi:hypothetical protein